MLRWGRGAGRGRFFDALSISLDPIWSQYYIPIMLKRHRLLGRSKGLICSTKFDSIEMIIDRHTISHRWKEILIWLDDDHVEPFTWYVGTRDDDSDTCLSHCQFVVRVYLFFGILFFFRKNARELLRYFIPTCRVILNLPPPVIGLKFSLLVILHKIKSSSCISFYKDVTFL